MNYISFLAVLDTWTLNNPNILSCGIVGSYARGAEKPSSDVDVHLLAPDIDLFLNDPSWEKIFGSPKTIKNETWGPVQTVRVFYEELEVEFNFATPSWARVPLDSGTARVLSDGITLLCDKTGLFQNALNALETNDIVTIRSHTVDDAPQLAELFYRSIHAIDDSIYSPAQKQAWAPQLDELVQKRWQNRIDVKKPFVAEYKLDGKDQVVGFIELEIDGHIDCLYVHPDAQRLGIASQLLQYAVNEARAFGLRKLYVEASKVAKPFFEQHEFTETSENEVTIRGVTLLNYKMERLI